MRNYYTHGLVVEYNKLHDTWTTLQYGDILGTFAHKADAYRLVADRGGEWVKGY